MRRPLESAVVRRDDQISRTRRLSAWIVGWATAGSISLAGVLGIAIPGHAATTGSNHASPAQPASGPGASNQGSSHQTSSHAGGHRHGLASPSSPPSAPSSTQQSSSSAPPVVSSGGS